MIRNIRSRGMRVLAALMGALALPVAVPEAPTMTKVVQDALNRKHQRRSIPTDGPYDWTLRGKCRRGWFLPWARHVAMIRRCPEHGLRFKSLRYRAVFMEETSGLRRSIKAKAFACPKCLRA